MSVSNLHKLRLKLHTDGNTSTDPNRTYDIYPLQVVDVSSRKEAFSISPPGLPAAQNIFLQVSGMQADITINFHLWEDGSDRSNGTHSSAVTSVREQGTYLEKTMQDEGFLAAWEIDYLSGPAFDDDEIMYETVDYSLFEQQSPKWKEARMTLRRGGTV